MLFNGITDEGLLREISEGRGDRLVTRAVSNSGTSSEVMLFSDKSRHSGVSEQHSWEPVIRPEQVVAGLGRG